MDGNGKVKRHFNMASKSSDEVVVQRARQMSHLSYRQAAIELRIGMGRMKRLIDEYGLVFARRARSATPYVKRDLSTKEAQLMAGKVVDHRGELFKRCPHCEDVKNVEQFGRHWDQASTYSSWCKTCKAKSTRKRNAGR